MMERADVLGRVKGVWYQPERPVEVSVRPASTVGMVIARAKCNLGLALLWSGLGHLDDLHPTRIVGRSALGVVTEQLAETPRGSFIRVNDGPRIYLREAVLLLSLLALAVGLTWWLAYTLGFEEHGPGFVIRSHVAPILHQRR